MLHEISFKSTNGRDSVQAWIYVPAAEPAGVIQLVHGFGEHSRRYLPMIVKFMEAGFIVAADDHVGHGKTALVNNCWGDWGDKGPHTMMEDEYVFMTGVKQMFPELPYFMFGHSMGSFIARDFMAKYGEELDGVTLCGTSGEFPGLDGSIDYLKKLVDEGKGLESDPMAGNVVMGWMFERCQEEVALGNEWICHDPFVQEDHAKDPFNAFTKPTSNRSFLDFCYMMKEITGPEWAAKVPDDLPVYNIGGDQDPVGQYGEGVYKVSNWLIDNGNDVVTELYSGYRHEIHNYAELKDEVVDGIIDFFEDCIGVPDDLLEMLFAGEELDEPVPEEEPAMEEPQVVEEALAMEEAPVAEESPAVEEIPAVEETPVVEPEVDVVPPVMEEVTVAQEEPVVEEISAPVEVERPTFQMPSFEMPPAEETISDLPKLDDISQIDEVPAAEEVPTVVEADVAEEAVAEAAAVEAPAAEPPATEEAPAGEEPPKEEPVKESFFKNFFRRD